MSLRPCRHLQQPLELALLGVLAVLWGSSYLLIEVAVSTIPPATLIAARVVIAALLLSALLWWRAERLPTDPRDWGLLFVQAVFNSIASWTLLAWGQQLVDSGLAAVLNSTSPIFVFLASAVAGRAGARSLMKFLGAVLGVAGVVLIVGADVLAGIGGNMLGQGAVLAGAVLYAGAALFGRRLAHLSAPVTAAGTIIWASVCLVPGSLIIDRPWTLSPTPGAVAATAALGAFSTALALMIYFRLLRTLGPLAVASQSYLRAGVGVLLGVVVLGEQVSSTLAAGLVAVIAGVVLITVPPRAPPPRAQITTPPTSDRSAGSGR